MTETMGRRERKKAATRKALADAALRLFLEHGYDNVGIKDVAEAADVSTTTLFKHFPSKEALVFDLDADVEAALVAAVRDRAAGTSVPAALREHVLRRKFVTGDPAADRFRRLVDGNQALRDYAHRMWMRHETALARAIAEDAGLPVDDAACAALAHFALETAALVHGRTDRRETVERAFDLLENGWHAAAGTAPPGD
ncbi:TetR/AcrR family transcriptional regulator [Actinomadura verrucosospora]|uniref:Transcriptional regulator, TetR family n=1 Tax=Actinomadura verrucosospora TaxID=46165 RepID=A0A7D3VP92_ACTVE|nr:TetR/AcrR family transcriptional regulator [Actinomadura verrucosospora]QKG19315.1 transcriptional regulator, TetR family [Actinomadura verrucosospora]